jgi:uncharacterized protein YgiM (DUF1202 family)
MRGHLAHLICTLALLAAAPVAAWAQADGPDYWAVTGVLPNDALNLRVAPNADSRAIARIPFNARGIRNYGCPTSVTFEQWKRMTEAQRNWSARSLWCEVEYQGKRGWVAGRFLKEDSAASR